MSKKAENWFIVIISVFYNEMMTTIAVNDINYLSSWQIQAWTGLELVTSVIPVQPTNLLSWLDSSIG